MAYLLDSVEHGRLRLAMPDELALRAAGLAAEVVACGHSHTPRLIRDGSGTLFVNPGAVGVQAYTDRDEPAHVSETGSPLARYAIVERQRDRDWRATFVALPLRSPGRVGRGGKERQARLGVRAPYRLRRLSRQSREVEAG